MFQETVKYSWSTPDGAVNSERIDIQSVPEGHTVCQQGGFTMLTLLLQDRLVLVQGGSTAGGRSHVWQLGAPWQRPGRHILSLDAVAVDESGNQGRGARQVSAYRHAASSG